MASKKRVKIDGMSFSEGQISALRDLEDGAHISRTTTRFFMRRFGCSPTSCSITFPPGTKWPVRERTKNDHMTCVTLMEKKLVEQDGPYEKGVGSSHTRYKLSTQGRKILKELDKLRLK